MCLSTAVTPTAFGFYTDDGFGWMLLAIVLLLAARFAPRRNASTIVWALMVGAFGLGTGYYSHDAAWVVAAGAAAAVLAAPRRWAWMLAATAGAAALLPLGRAWTWGTADIDVFGIVQGGAATLLNGQNPYAATFPAGLYTAPGTYHMVPVHFSYGPALAVLAAPGAFAGDVRVMSVAMFIVLFAGILGLAATHQDKRRQWWLAAFCVAFPLTTTMVLHSWADTYSVALFVLWAALRRRHGVLASLMLGVSFATKFTIVAALIPFWLWSWKVRRESALAVLVAVAIALPFAIATGVGDFIHDVIGVFADLPTRFDELTVNGYLYHQGQGSLDGWVGVVAVVVVACLVLWRKPRDLSDSFVSSALLLTISFFFAKEASINYYFIPITLLLMALATNGLPLDDPENMHLPLMTSKSRLEWVDIIRNRVRKPAA